MKEKQTKIDEENLLKSSAESQRGSLYQRAKTYICCLKKQRQNSGQLDPSMLNLTLKIKKNAHKMQRRKAVYQQNPEYNGPELPLNYLRIDNNIRKVYKVAIGQSHLLM